MSHEPRRLLAASAGSADGELLSPLERSLLLAGQRRREPDAGVRDRVWRSMAIAGAATGAAATGAALMPKGTATAAVAITTKVKLLLLTAAIASAGAVGSAVVVSRAAERTEKSDRSVAVVATPAQTHTTMTATTTKPVVTDPALQLPPETVVRPADLKAANAKPAKPAVAPKITTTSSAEIQTTPPPTPPPTKESELRAEADLLAAARADLARGDSTSALRRIAESKTRFPNGMLAEEREALEVRAIDASGDHARAGKLARAFLEHHPKSPLRSSLEPIANANKKMEN